VPLSEHEQRLLDQIERALYQEDPKFASTVRQTDLRTHMKRRLVKAALVLVVGFAVLITGAVVQQYLVGIAGFAIMVAALLLAMTAYKRMGQGTAALGPEAPAADPRRSAPAGRSQRSRPQRPQSSGGLVARLEERWRRRWDERGR